MIFVNNGMMNRTTLLFLTLESQLVVEDENATRHIDSEHERIRFHCELYYNLGLMYSVGFKLDSCSHI